MHSFHVIPVRFFHAIPVRVAGWFPGHWHGSHGGGDNSALLYVGAGILAIVVIVALLRNSNAK